MSPSLIHLLYADAYQSARVDTRRPAERTTRSRRVRATPRPADPRRTAR
jgi:hypothetical protein